MDGWIIVHRKLQNNWVWDNERYLKWWLTILLNVNHEEVKFNSFGEVYTCNPGESFRSIEQWTLLFKCSKPTTVRFFKLLEDDGMIECRTVGTGNRRKNLLSVSNWAEYQKLTEINLKPNVTENFTEETAKIEKKLNRRKRRPVKESEDVFSEMETGNFTEENGEISDKLNRTFYPNNNIYNNNISYSDNLSNSNYKYTLLSEIKISDYTQLNPDYFEIAKSFVELFRNNLIEAGASTRNVDKAKGTCIDDIRLMIETDGYTIDDLREVYSFLKKDAFWKQNILTTSKLRKQMDKLKLKIHGEHGQTGKPGKEGTSWNELAQIVSGFK